MACTYKGCKAKLNIEMMIISCITNHIWWRMMRKVLNIVITLMDMSLLGYQKHIHKIRET